MHDEKFGINCRLRSNFLIVSLVKASMSAPHLCKLRTYYLSYRHWPWCNGVNKSPPFRYFLIAKGGTKIIVHLPIAEEFLKLK
jgi:hypothetical protein